MTVLPSLLRPAVATLLVTLGLPLAGAAAQRGRDFRAGDRGYVSRVDTTVVFDRRGTVRLTLPAGDIVVTGWSKDQIHVVASSDYDNIRLDASTMRVSLDVGGARRWSSGARFELTVPAGARVTARTQSGDITVRGTKSEVDAHAQSGDIRVEDAAGRVELNSLSGSIDARQIAGGVDAHSVSGDVRLGDVRGDVEAESTSGDVVLRGATSRFVRLRSTSGDIDYDGGVDAAGRYDLMTHSGNVRLTLPADAGALLSIATWSGSIESDFPITLKPGDHGIGAGTTKRFTFQIGNGASRISAESFSGDITISAKARERR